ncbi:GerAB/ArcD/ProY family transporter [Sporosarcina sp. FSL K6-1508]|uniref:GerAB/ArcD/ProY family transporter n=1 Tax=Sporosarcina sp. FSL K6-1508 TaxID=2921553 RepID=UPI0030F90778
MNINISRTQFFLFLFVAQTGTVFISFQGPMIKAAGRDAWIIFLVAGLFHYALLLFYERFYPSFILGPIMSWLYKGYWLFLTVTFISYVDYTLAAWAFPNTPQFIVIALMVIISLYANLSRAETTMNLSVLLIPLIPLFLFFLALSWRDLEWTYLFPSVKASVAQWGHGMLKAQYAFIGIELFLIYRRFVDPDRKIKGLPLFIYQMIWLLFFLFTILITTLFFAREDMLMIPEPLMYILKSQQVSFIERLDLFFIYIWMSWSIITITLFSFSALFVHRMHNKKHSKRDIIIFHALLMLLPLFGLTKEATEKLQDSLVFAHLLFAIVLPVIIILVNRRKSI